MSSFSICVPMNKLLSSCQIFPNKLSSFRVFTSNYTNLSEKPKFHVRDVREISRNLYMNQRKRRENTDSAKLERNSTKEGECVAGIGALQTLDWDTSAINLSV